jgi:hypothetical protein
MPLKIVNPHDSVHFRQRLFERYGILVTASEMWDIRDKFHTAKLIRQEPDKSIYLMNIQGKAVRIVYNTKERRFITALSPEDAW